MLIPSILKRFFDSIPPDFEVLSSNELTVLMLLHHLNQPCRPSDITRALPSIGKANYVVKKLETRGYIEKIDRYHEDAHFYSDKHLPMIINDCGRAVLRRQKQCFDLLIGTEET